LREKRAYRSTSSSLRRWPKKVGVLRTTAEFLRERAGDAKPADLLRYVRAAPQMPPMVGDEPG